MKRDARVRNIVALQRGELLGSLGQPRHQHPVRCLIAVDPVALQILCRERLEHVGCGLSAFDHKRSDRAEAVPKKRMTAPAATPEEGLAEVPVNEPYICQRPDGCIQWQGAVSNVGGRYRQ